MGNGVMQHLIDLLQEELDKSRETAELRCYPSYLELMIRYFTRALKAKQEGKYLAGHTVFIPIELFYAMDIVPLHLESYALFLNFFEDLKGYLDLAAEFGLRPEVCSAHRVTDAMVLAQAFPRPDFIVFSSQVCDNTPKSGESMAELYQTPSYFLDRPYHYSKRGLSYYTEEMADLVKFLEEQTGQKMDYQRLQETLALSYRATQLYIEINELRKAIPAPMPPEGYFAQMAVSWLLAGLPEAVTLLEQLRDEIRERTDKKIGVIPEEQYRIYIPFVLPWWDMSILDWMQEEHGAVIVMDLVQSWKDNGEWFLDASPPLENLARKAFFNPGFQSHGPMEYYLEDAVQNVIDYHADGAIFFAHIGCRHGCAYIRSLKDELQEKLGIPLAVVDCDIIDKSFTTTEEVQEKLEGFFELLEGQKTILNKDAW